MKLLRIASADVGGQKLDVRIRDGRIQEWGWPLAPEAGEDLLDAGGGALLPGLRDHHLHLLALAAARRSLRCGPPQVRDAPEFRNLLARAAAEMDRSGEQRPWLRGVGYHESVAGSLDRHILDRSVGQLPLRVQHRSGALWMLNSAGLERLGLEPGEARPSGMECDAAGRPTGRLYRLDSWLRDRLASRGESRIPDLKEVGRSLSALGVTGVCDATPGNGAETLDIFTAAVADDRLRQRLLLMGGLDLPRPRHPRIKRGALKILLDENSLPEEEHLVAQIRRAHGAGRGVAFHCVTRAELLVAASALERAGSLGRDRIEHASLAPPDLIECLAKLRATVVTQPNFLHERGDAYLREVEPRDHPWLYRGRAFLSAGLPLAGGTDAPFGNCDPWAAMRAAVERRSAGGAEMDPAEALTAEEALALFTSPLEHPGQSLAVLTRGAPADLLLLDRPWSRARERLDGDDVRATLVGGRTVWRRNGSPDTPAA